MQNLISRKQSSLLNTKAEPLTYDYDLHPAGKGICHSSFVLAASMAAGIRRHNEFVHLRSCSTLPSICHKQHAEGNMSTSHKAVPSIQVLEDSDLEATSRLSLL